jgi:hypothetical protein
MGWQQARLCLEVTRKFLEAIFIYLHFDDLVPLQLLSRRCFRSVVPAVMAHRSARMDIDDEGRGETTYDQLYHYKYGNQFTISLEKILEIAKPK